MTRLTILAIIAASFFNCAARADVHETVLRPGERITATNSSGTIRISYVAEKTRLYEWEGNREKRTLQQRTERWYGCLDLYDPAETFFPSSKPRLVIEEGIKNFRSKQQIETVFNGGKTFEHWIYDNSGLVVGFAKVPERGNQVNVDVFQFLINGKKPTSLSGAQPTMIHRESFDPSLTAKYNVSKGEKPQDEIPPLINDPFNSTGAQAQKSSP